MAVKPYGENMLEVQIIREVKRLRKRGSSARLTALALNQAGYRMRSGAAWNALSIYRIEAALEIQASVDGTLPPVVVNAEEQYKLPEHA